LATTTTKKLSETIKTLIWTKYLKVKRKMIGVLSMYKLILNMPWGTSMVKSIILIHLYNKYETFESTCLAKIEF